MEYVLATRRPRIPADEKALRKAILRMIKEQNENSVDMHFMQSGRPKYINYNFYKAGLISLMLRSRKNIHPTSPEYIRTERTADKKESVKEPDKNEKNTVK